MIHLALMLFAAGAANADQTKPPAAVATVAAPSTEAVATARRILVKIHTEEQQRVALAKLAPVFAATVLATSDKGMPEEVNAALQAPGGTQRVTTILAEEYRSAFEVRLPQLLTAIAEQMAKDMTIDDLKAVDAFIDTPAGAKWGGEFLAIQQAGVEAGRRAGEAAGTAAAAATLRRLRGQDTGS